MSADIGKQPEPTTEEPELHPGGADAVIPDEPTEAPIPRDLDVEDNAAVEDVLPDELSQPDEDKQQAPDDGKVSGEDDTEEEPPA